MLYGFERHKPGSSEKKKGGSSISYLTDLERTAAGGDSGVVGDGDRLNPTKNEDTRSWRGFNTMAVRG